MASCPCRVSKCAVPLQPDLVPSCIDCASNSRIASIELGSDGTGTICKGLHLHGGSWTETRHRLIPNLTNLVPALAAGGFGNRVEREIGKATAFMWVHAGLVLRKFSRLGREAMFRGRISHVSQT